MAINFPTSLDVFTDPTASDQLNLPSHSGQHTDLNNAVEALEAKVGINSSAVTTSHDYKIAQLEAGATGGKILQVVSTTKTDTFTTTSTSFTDLTGLSVAITPTAATSKVLLILTFGTWDSNATNRLFAQVERDGTPIGVGDPAGSRTPAAIAVTPAAGNRPTSNSWSYLDSPASTSALTYQTQVMVASGTLYVNRSQLDTDASSYTRTVSTLTAMEVAG